MSCIDTKLNWKIYVHHISLKISKLLGIINRIKWILSRSLLRLLYTTLIVPYCSYCNIVWGGAREVAMSRLIILQKCALRIITPIILLVLNHYCPSLDSLISKISMYFKSVFMYKTIHNLIPFSCVHNNISVRHPYILRKPP